MPHPPKRPTSPRKPAPPPIVVLSRNRKLYSTRRLIQAARDGGHRIEVFDTLSCSVVVEPGRPMVVCKGRELGDARVVVPRIGASITDYGLAVVAQFEAMGIPVLASADGIRHSRNKLRSLQLLARSGVPVPRTVLAHEGADVEDLVERIGGLPCIVKLTKGTQGIGVMIARGKAEISSILGTMWALGQEIILQEFVRESEGRDVRVLVVGDVCLGAMKRVGKLGEFRSNLHRGGAGEPFELPDEYAQVAIRAAGAVGLELAGVDILESASGPRVMEINSSPGLEGFERATGVDAAGAVIRRAVALSQAQ